MKLVIVTAVDEYKKEVIDLFRRAGIENFSESDVEGHKTTATNNLVSSWFAREGSRADSELFFSFAEEDTVDELFKLIKGFNQNLETNNPLKAVVVPIEKHI
ncbi:hypothetical protein [Maribacter sp. 2307ULW6-5]|uniref:hypothetical protein n=1 Tax=Maribacter sp. 2307ULW6-5 TaxID=3386275 RepID=UPI0039BD38CC